MNPVIRDQNFRRQAGATASFLALGLLSRFKLAAVAASSRFCRLVLLGSVVLSGAAGSSHADTMDFDPSLVAPDGVPWPAMLNQPIEKVLLSIHFPGNNEFMDATAQKSIEEESVQDLSAMLASIDPEIEVSRPKLNVGSGLSVVAAYYSVWLTKWHDAEGGRDVVLGVVLLRIRTNQGPTDVPEFAPSLFESGSEPQSIYDAVRRAIKLHMAQAIASPIKASLSR